MAIKRILVVDDCSDAVDSLSILLRSWGYTTATAYDGVTAIETARTFDPEVVFLDIAMPGMDGLEVAKSLRGEPSSHSLLVVAISGYGRPEDRLHAYEAGIHHYLLKPADPAALKAMLEGYAAETQLETPLHHDWQIGTG